MSPRCTSCRRGSILVMVLVITAIGLLFGAGSLLLFRYQCQLRIDRQHELEKVYAVRSVLNYIRTINIGSEINQWFDYRTASERFLRLQVKPSRLIFPDPENERHFDMGDVTFRRSFTSSHPAQYNEDLDYEYGGVENTDIQLYKSSNPRYCGLEFYDQSATNNVTWWVNIGMLGTGGWLQQEYGRRYYFLPKQYVGDGESEKTRDIMRLCLIRNVTNEMNNAGCRHGWPLSRNGERALVFQITPRTGTAADDSGAELSLSEYVYSNGHTNITPILFWPDRPAKGYKGFQISGRVVCLFDISQSPVTDNLGNTYAFSITNMLEKGTYDYFEKGSVYSEDGKTILSAPELRAVFEVEAASNKRPVNDSKGGDILTNFRVTPAYQYDVLIEHPLGEEPQLATVAQRIGEYNDDSSAAWYTILTYDTHGTENKGFRKDERDYERKKSER